VASGFPGYIGPGLDHLSLLTGVWRWAGLLDRRNKPWFAAQTADKKKRVPKDPF
jgi:hypothetical protein